MSKSGKKYESKSKFKRKSIIPQLTDMATSDDDTRTDKSLVLDDHTLLVMTYYDHLNRLTEIHMNKYQYHAIPWVLMRLIALIAPFNKNLQKFVIKGCKVDMYTIHELSKLLPLTNITEVCLDQSPLPEGNYDVLLCDTSSIRSLSLARCNINDIVCERIAARLKYLEPAENTLVTLNLSTNYITDVGAEHLGAALRTNRHLRYLNVAGNQITDVGANFIFEVLKQFPLTSEEIIAKRKRLADYLNKKQELIHRGLCEFKLEDHTSKKSSKRSAPSRGHSARKEKVRDSLSDEGMKAKVEIMVADMMGPFEDPFGVETTKVLNGHCFSVGNLVLCYLNLAYNNLTFASIQQLISLLSYQQRTKTARLCGLLNIIVEGNYLPEECKELKDLNILLKNIQCFGGRSLTDKMSKMKKSTVIISNQEKALSE